MALKFAFPANMAVSLFSLLLKTSSVGVPSAVKTGFHEGLLARLPAYKASVSHLLGLSDTRMGLWVFEGGFFRWKKLFFI